MAFYEKSGILQLGNKMFIFLFILEKWERIDLFCKVLDPRNSQYTSKILSDAASRALGSIINKLKCNKGLFHKTLYDKCVSTILDYGSGIWGFKNYQAPNTIHHRAIRAFP